MVIHRCVTLANLGQVRLKPNVVQHEDLGYSDTESIDANIVAGDGVQVSTTLSGDGVFSVHANNPRTGELGQHRH